ARVAPSAARPVRRIRVPHARGGARPPLPPARRRGGRGGLGGPAPAALGAWLDALAPAGRDARALAAEVDAPARPGAKRVRATEAAAERPAGSVVTRSRPGIVKSSLALPARIDRPLQGIGFIVVGATVFPIQDVLIKGLSGAYPVLQIVFVRSLVSVGL